MLENQKSQHDQNIESILDSVFDEIMILNKDFSIKDVNKTFCLKYGVNKKQVIGNKCYKVTHGRDKVCELPECKCPVKDVMKTGKSSKSIHSHQANGNEIFLEILAYPIKNENGNIKQVVKIGRDISELKEAEIDLKESEEKFRNLVENFPYSIILLDSRKRVYECNSSAELYLNRPKDDLKHNYFFDILQISEKLKNSLDEIIQNVLDYGLSELIEIEFINRNNNKSWLEAFFSLIEIGSKKFIQVMLQDITERIFAEKIVREENKRLMELDKIKKNMTAKTSEKLKSPLNIMSSASDILLNSYRDKLDENAINLLEIIKNGGEKSLNLVGKIVDISKIESDNYILNKQTYSLTKIIKESVNSITDDLMNCNINFKYKLSEDIYSDVDKLRIKHAIKEILTYLIQITKRKSISIYLKKVENIGELLIKSEFDQQIVPNILLELPYSKEIIKLHNGQIFTELGKHKTDLTIKIHLPIKKWKEALIQLYIICKSGIPLYHHDFSKFGRNHDSSLISGGIIGLMTILKAILQGETQIKSIDHGDRTIIFDSNRTKDIVFVLIVKENIIVFERKLASLIEEFDKNYKRLIEDIEENCVDQDNWRSLKYLVQKYFEMSE